MDIDNVSGIDHILEPRTKSNRIGHGTNQAEGFSEMLKSAVQEVNQLGHEAGRLEDAVAKGESINIHQAIIAGEKAGLSFKLMMQVRNKVLDAYQEIARMQV